MAIRIYSWLQAKERARFDMPPYNIYATFDSIDWIPYNDIEEYLEFTRGYPREMRPE